MDHHPTCPSLRSADRPSPRRTAELWTRLRVRSATLLLTFLVTLGLASPTQTAAAVEMATGSISVKGPSSQLLPGTTVQVLSGSCSGPAVWLTTTGSSPTAYGSFSFWLPVGSYCVKTLAVPAGYTLPVPMTVTVKTGSANSFTVWVSGPVTGALVAKNASGQGVDGVTALIRMGGCAAPGQAVWQSTTATNRWSVGGFGISLMPGPYCVTVTGLPQGYQMPAPQDAMVTAAGPIWITVWLPSLVTGAVIARNPLGAPVDGVRAVIRTGSCAAPSAAVWENITATSQWSAGAFGISLAPGAYCVIATQVPINHSLPLPLDVTVKHPSPVWIALWVPPFQAQGSGPTVLPIDVRSSAGIAEFTCENCPGPIRVVAEAVDGTTDVLVDRVDSYARGRHLVGFRDTTSKRYTKISIQANGAWTFQLYGEEGLTEVSSVFTGYSDDVLSLGGMTTAANFFYNGPGKFSTWVDTTVSFGGMVRLVDNFGPYAGNVTLRAPAVVVVHADRGPWSIQIG